MKKSLIAGFVAVLAMAACSPEHQSAQFIDQDIDAAGIVGAEKYSKSDLGLKATVLLRNGGSGEGFCTGTLIDSRIVLTAAHCLNNKEAADVQVSFADGTTRSALGKVQHSGYLANATEQKFFSVTNKDSDDIALLSLKESAPASAQIAILPKTSLKIGKHKVRAFGIGSTSAKKDDSGTMRMVNLEGQVKKGRESKIVYNQRQGKGLCQGDSGGPQFMYSNGQPVVVAITTSLDNVTALWGSPVGDMCRADSVSTLTGQYYSWIEKGKKRLLTVPKNGSGKIVPDCFSDENFLSQMRDNFTHLDFNKKYKVVGEYREGFNDDRQKIWIFDIVGVGSESGKAVSATGSFTEGCFFDYIGGSGW